MRVIVTRPAAQAARWVQSLAAHGIAAVALPLIDILPPADLSAVEQAWRTLAQQRLVVFVSPNAAEQFFLHRPADAVWPRELCTASIGPGTTQVLVRLGVPRPCIVEPAEDVQRFDSEALWQRLRDRAWTGAPVLVVRGDGGREWLAETLRGAGARIEFVCAYRRAAPRLDAAAREVLDDAMARPDSSLWFFSSSEAIDHLAEACPGASWSRSGAIATHPRIAERARGAGFAAVHETRPLLDAVVACIQSIAS